MPCYIDQFYPKVGVATLELLESLGVSVDYPVAQTCCGQPMANAGCVSDTRPLAEKFVSVFSRYEYVVCPSGSCVSMVRNHYEKFFVGDAAFAQLRNRVYELCEFLTDVVQIESI